MPENGLKDLVHETTVRVLHSDATALLDVPRNHVAEESALADPAFSEDCDVPPAGARGKAAAKLHETAQLPIEIVGADMELGNPARRDARLKAEHNLPYADCFAAAVAQLKKASLATAERDVSSVQSILKIVWLS